MRRVSLSDRVPPGAHGTSLDIKNGMSFPSLALVQKACEILKVQFNFRGIHIDGRSFEKNTRRPFGSVATQGNLRASLGNWTTAAFR
jgi:hypothetical protein